MTRENAIVFPTTEELIAGWTNETGYFGGRAMWDDAARDYARMPVPSMDDSFLSFVNEHVKLQPTMRVLDIGCGSGVFSIALAKHVQSVVGVDFSPAMIAAARNKARECGAKNVRFVETDFRTITCGAPFDIVFAHLTPAVAEGHAFAKMMELSKGWCFRAAPVRRTDHTLFAARQACGIPIDNDARDQGFLKEIVYVWQSGCTPSMRHYTTTWHSERDVESVRKAYLNGMLAPELTPAQRNMACAYVDSIAENGMVREHIDTTIMMMAWRSPNAPNGRD